MLQSDGREVNIGYRHARLAVSPGISNAGKAASIRVFNGSNGRSHQQTHLPGALQTYDVDTIAFTFADELFSLEVKIVPPTWIPAARNLRTSSSSICRTSSAPDNVKISL